MTDMPDRARRHRAAAAPTRSTDDTGTRPSTDLFDRVVGSIADERARRRRRRRYVALGVAQPRARHRRRAHPDPTRERTTGAWTGGSWSCSRPACWSRSRSGSARSSRRFGRAYAADVFHDNPQTGKSYIVLTDIVYYLIFTRLHPVHGQLRAAAAGGRTSGAAQVKVRGRPDRRHPADHRRPARPEHRADAGARPAVLPQPHAVRAPAARGLSPGSTQPTPRSPEEVVAEGGGQGRGQRQPRDQRGLERVVGVRLAGPGDAARACSSGTARGARTRARGRRKQSAMCSHQVAYQLGVRRVAGRCVQRGRGGGGLGGDPVHPLAYDGRAGPVDGVDEPVRAVDGPALADGRVEQRPGVVEQPAGRGGAQARRAGAAPAGPTRASARSSRRRAGTGGPARRRCSPACGRPGRVEVLRDPPLRCRGRGRARPG